MKEAVVGGTDSVFTVFLPLTLQSSWSKYHWDKLDQVNDGNCLFQITFLTCAPSFLLLSGNVSPSRRSCSQLTSCVTQMHFYFIELKQSLYFAIEWLSFHQLPLIEAVIILCQSTTAKWPKVTPLVLCAPLWTARFCSTCNSLIFYIFNILAGIVTLLNHKLWFVSLGLHVIKRNKKY